MKQRFITKEQHIATYLNPGFKLQCLHGVEKMAMQLQLVHLAVSQL